MRPDMERVVEHIESKWCASVLGEDLIYVIRGTDNPSSNSAVHCHKPSYVFLTTSS